MREECNAQTSLVDPQSVDYPAAEKTCSFAVVSNAVCMSPNIVGHGHSCHHGADLHRAPDPLRVVLCAVPGTQSVGDGTQEDLSGAERRCNGAELDAFEASELGRRYPMSYAVGARSEIA